MMKFAKRAVSLLLVLTMVLTICISLFPTSAQAASFTGVTGPTLVKRDGVWYYVKNGAVCYDRTLVKYSGSWWFVKDGKVASNLTTLVKYNRGPLKTPFRRSAGSFAPTFAYQNLEIHRVFLRF